MVFLGYQCADLRIFKFLVVVLLCTQCLVNLVHCDGGRAQGARCKVQARGRGCVGVGSRLVVDLSLTSARGSLRVAEHVHGLGSTRKSRVQRVRSVRGPEVAYKGSKGSRSRVQGVYSQDVAWEAICQALLSI